MAAQHDVAIKQVGVISEVEADCLCERFANTSRVSPSSDLV